MRSEFLKKENKTKKKRRWILTGMIGLSKMSRRKKKKQDEQEIKTIRLQLNRKGKWSRKKKKTRMMECAEATSSSQRGGIIQDGPELRLGLLDKCQLSSLTDMGFIVSKLCGFFLFLLTCCRQLLLFLIVRFDLDILSFCFLFFPSLRPNAYAHADMHKSNFIENDVVRREEKKKWRTTAIWRR